MPNATPIPWGRLALCAALAMLTLTIPDVVLAQAGGDLAQPLTALYRLVRGAIYAAAVLAVVGMCLAFGFGRLQWVSAHHRGGRVLWRAQRRPHHASSHRVGIAWRLVADSGDLDTLATATCEVALTLPQMVARPAENAGRDPLCSSAASASTASTTGRRRRSSPPTVVMVWGAVREAVSRDLWGFHNFCAWLATDFRFDTGGKDPWRGARLCALPTTARLMRGVVRARSGDAYAAR